MEDEEQASSGIQDAGENNNRNVEVDTLARSTVTSIGGYKHLDTEGCDMNAVVTHPIPSQFSDVIEEVRVLLSSSVAAMKSRNTSNGYLIGVGRKKSMTREPWEHLQYAVDLLDNPKANIYDLLTAIECLRHSGINYEAQPIPWDEIEEMYPRPPARAITPIMHPGPPEEDIEALALEYGYTRVVHTEPVVVQEIAAAAEVPVTTAPPPEATVEPVPPVPLPFDIFDVVLSTAFEVPAPVEPTPEPAVDSSWIGKPRVEPVVVEAVSAEPESDDDDDEWNHPAPYVHEDMAAMVARQDRKLQVERNANMARLEREMAEEAAPALKAATEPSIADQILSLINSNPKNYNDLSAAIGVSVRRISEAMDELLLRGGIHRMLINNMRHYSTGEALVIPAIAQNDGMEESQCLN
jgi:hypothetical protein